MNKELRRPRSTQQTMQKTAHPYFFTQTSSNISIFTNRYSQLAKIYQMPHLLEVTLTHTHIVLNYVLLLPQQHVELSTILLKPKTFDSYILPLREKIHNLKI
jgi:hypothetical protein